MVCIEVFMIVFIPPCFGMLGDVNILGVLIPNVVDIGS